MRGNATHENPRSIEFIETKAQGNHSLSSAAEERMPFAPPSRLYTTRAIFRYLLCKGPCFCFVRNSWYLKWTGRSESTLSQEYFAALATE
jgi:hypothetical protein